MVSHRNRWGTFQRFFVSFRQLCLIRFTPSPSLAVRYHAKFVRNWPIYSHLAKSFTYLFSCVPQSTGHFSIMFSVLQHADIAFSQTSHSPPSLSPCHAGNKSYVILHATTAFGDQSYRITPSMDPQHGQCGCPLQPKTESHNRYVIQCVCKSVSV